MASIDILSLPHNNRKLNTDESKELFGKLYENWGFDGNYWEPSKSKNEIIFLMDKFITKNDEQMIIECILKHYNTFFTVDENYICYETKTLDFERDETFYTNKNCTWFIFISNDSYIAFGGKVLKTIKELFFNRREQINKYEL